MATRSVTTMSFPAVRICFVCLGNICRSPAAEAVFADVAEREGLAVEVASAGTSGYHVGDPPHEHSRAEARRRGLSMDHRGRRFTAGDFEHFDMVVAMDSDNVRDLRRLAADAGAGAEKKIVLLRSFDPTVGAEDDVDLADPWGQPAREFAAMFDAIERAAGGLADHVRTVVSSTDRR